MEKKSIPVISAFSKKCSPFFLFLTLFLFTTISQVYAQQNVNGVVKDEKGAAVEGVSILEKGTSNGTTTNANGQYSIAVSGQQAVLVFSFTGYLTKEEKIGSRTTIDVSLSQSANNLDEVIVVGYGTQRKRDVTGAITSVNSKQIEERQAVNLADALQGQAAGLLVINAAGEPGAESSITIRGGSTFSSAGNSPLYVIDGVIGANGNNINPNDIKSIEVLKDAASSAIYGSRAANGVIIITTKGGQAGKPRVEARYLRTWGTMAHKLRQSNASEVRLFRQKQSPNSSSAGTSSDSLNPGFNADNDYQAALTRVAIKDQYDLSVSGGSKDLTYYNSIRYVNDRGLILNSWAKQVQVRTNIDFKPSDRFRYSARFQFGYRKRNDINEGNTINQTFQRPTNFTLYYPDGSLTGYVSGRRNPLSVALYEVNLDDRYDGQIFNELQYNIFKSLKLTANFAASLEQTHDVEFSPKILSSNNPLTNSGSEGYYREIQLQGQTYLNYDKNFGIDHKVYAMAGFSAEREQFNETSTEGRNYANENVISVNMAQDILAAEVDAGANSLASFFGRAGYSFKGKYTLNGTFRYDGSSRFGKEKSWGFFPSFGFAWRISDEKFMDWSKGISFRCQDQGKLWRCG